MSLVSWSLGVLAAKETWTPKEPFDKTGPQPASNYDHMFVEVSMTD